MSVQSDHSHGYNEACAVSYPGAKAPHNDDKKEWSDKDFEGNGKLGMKVKGCDWKRMSVKDGHKLYEGGIEANDIHQGALGDCYFLAAIAALAEDPKYIEDLIKPAGKSCYGVKLHHFGNPQWVWVDDQFPTHGGKPLFSHSADKELWVLLLEKAYAKMHGNYGAIASGLPSDALTDLTGCPVTTIDTVHTWNHDIWQELTTCVGGGGTVVSCASISGSPFRRFMTWGLERYFWRLARLLWNLFSMIPYCPCILNFFFFLYSFILYGIFWLLGQIDNLCCGIFTMIHVVICTTIVGLVPGHAYSILDVKGEGCTKLVKLRNPWGKTEWKGFYGDGSFCWSCRGGLADELGIKPEDDGAFWMHLNDFACYFDRVDACHMLPDIKSERVRGKLNALQTCFLFHVDAAETVCSVQVNQPRHAGMNDHMVNWRLRVVESGPQVADSEQGLSPGYASATFTRDSSLATSFMSLKPGKYAILIDCHPSDKKDVNRNGGVDTTIVIASKNCENIRWDDKKLEKAAVAHV